MVIDRKGTGRRPSRDTPNGTMHRLKALLALLTIS